LDYTSSTVLGRSFYKIQDHRLSWADQLSSEFQLERNTIVSDFRKLLPDISGESHRFRSLQKFVDLVEKPLLSIRSIGAKIYSVLDSDLKNKLKEAKDIHIITNDLEIPWEIINDGEELFCLRYSCGISPLIRRDKLPMKLKRRHKLKVLFVVDTKDNLAQTRSEVRSITSMLGSNNIEVGYDILEGKKATYNSVRNYILQQNLDIVHVAAHTEFDESNPHDSGVVLNDGLLRAKDIYNDVVTGPPWLVFMNSCESARTMDSRYVEEFDQLSGLATAFLVAGASSYIGTICRISDKAASQIAVKFYDKLLKGATVGESMQNARKEFFNDHLEDEDLSWLSFRVYGNPNAKRDLLAEALIDMEEKVNEYIAEKKKRRRSFTIMDLARDLNMSVSEVRQIYSRVA
jgi:hypothetical protein